MGSGLIYAAIVAIWGLLLVPMWMRKHETDLKISEVQKFSTAMETLKDGQLPEPRTAPTVQTKRAVRVGLADPDKRRRMRSRRIAFSAVALSLPVSVIGVLLFALPSAFLISPLISFVLYVVWVRNDIARRAQIKERNQTSGSSRVSRDEKPEAASRRSHLRESLAAIRRSATEKLLETEPELDTEKTPSWQPLEQTVVAEKTWTAPETPLPPYVSAPAASVVPREIDRVHGEWNGAAMLEEAQRQRQAALADLVNSVQEVRQVAAVDTTPTTELPRVATA